MFTTPKKLPSLIGAIKEGKNLEIIKLLIDEMKKTQSADEFSRSVLNALDFVNEKLRAPDKKNDINLLALKKELSLRAGLNIAPFEKKESKESKAPPAEHKKLAAEIKAQNEDPYRSGREHYQNYVANKNNLRELAMASVEWSSISDPRYLRAKDNLLLGETLFTIMKFRSTAGERSGFSYLTYAQFELNMLRNLGIAAGFISGKEGEKKSQKISVAAQELLFEFFLPQLSEKQIVLKGKIKDPDYQNTIFEVFSKVFTAQQKKAQELDDTLPKWPAFNNAMKSFLNYLIKYDLFGKKEDPNFNIFLEIANQKLNAERRETQRPYWMTSLEQYFTLEDFTKMKKSIVLRAQQFRSPKDLELISVLNTLESSIKNSFIELKSTSKQQAEPPAPTSKGPERKLR